jgi:hypothetical protein
VTLSITFFDKVKYKSTDFINRDADFFGNGVVRLTDFPISFSSPANMAVQIGAGTAWVNGMRVHNDSNMSLTFAPADPTNPRIDIIQIGYTATTDANGDTTGQPVLQIKQGIASPSPIEPGPDPNFVKLYAITIAANQTTITSSNVIDRRALVPLNVDGSQISNFNGTTTSYVNAVFADLFGNTSVVLSGGVATKNGTVPNQLDVTAANVYFAGGQHVNFPASQNGQFTTSTPNTTYYLDYNSDGTTSWGTSHSVKSGYVTICQVTTDGSGNISTVTDKRPTAVNLLSGATGSIKTKNNTLDDGTGKATFAGQITSQVATGTSPFSVSSTTVNTNLNADMVDGYHLNQGVQTTDSPTFAGLTVSGAVNLNGGATLASGQTLTNNGTISGGTVSPSTLSGTISGNPTWSGTHTFNNNVSAPTFTSNIATGTAPLTVTSTTKVTNLNADMVDGYHLNQGVQTTDSPTFAGLTVTGNTSLNNNVTLASGKTFTNNGTITGGTVSGLSNLSTTRNTLDDGTGKATFSGLATFNGGITVPSGQTTTINGPLVGAYQSNGDITGSVSDLNGNTFAVAIAAPSGATVDPFGITTGGGASAVKAFSVSKTNVVATKNNTLDDGSGNAMFASTVKAQGYNLAEILSGGYKIQSGGGSGAVTTGGTPVTVNITFPVAFSSAPTAFAVPTSANNDAGYVNVRVTTVSATGMTVQINSYTAQTVWFSWLAIGS